jgi:NADPH-dependent curcumin reductase CurA
VDYFYDTVGGEVLDTVLDVINEKGKILSIGMMSQENGKEPYPIRNLNLIARKGVSIIGFIYWHHLQYFENGELDATVRPLLERKDIEYRTEVFDGIENAPTHFINMLEGKYAGKVVIKIASL